jgi:hypothetical protein
MQGIGSGFKELALSAILAIIIVVNISQFNATRNYTFMYVNNVVRHCIIRKKYRKTHVTNNYG